MTRIEKNACRMAAPYGTRRRSLRLTPIASAVSAILAAAAIAQAQESPATGALEEVVVTAQKVSENLQNVPISIEVFNNQTLAQLNVAGIDDYVKYMPAVSYVRGLGQGGNNSAPTQSHVYIRGVVSGGEGNHSGVQPSVGTYIDEQPVTTIDGTVDIHIYDIDRIEVLEGPQGTLYGASSEAGTIRIITNKPDPTAFKAGYDVGLNSVDHGGIGYEAEGFVNLPLAPIAAIRLVGWEEKDAGYIDNVAGTDRAACTVNGIRTYPSWSGAPYQAPRTPCPAPGVIGAGSVSNAAFVRNDYNRVDTRGGRAAARVLAGDNWTITPTVMWQKINAEGFFGYDPAVGDLQVAHFLPEDTVDAWTQSALTVEGKLSNLDLVYAGAYMKRTTHTLADYSDYSLSYDRVYGSGAFWVGNDGNPIYPAQSLKGSDVFGKWSHEVRLTTPQNLPVKATVGAFMQRQLHDIRQQYTMPGYNGDGFAQALSVPGYNNTIWLTNEQRVDRDKAVFGQVTWDITSSLSLSGGYRYFTYDNSLQGFLGFSANYGRLIGSSAGMLSCTAPAAVAGAPCTNLSKSVSDRGTVPRVNVTYKIDPDRLVYATYSKGFRPGGVNRAAGFGPYAADFLINYEVGWKTQWFDHRLRWNGAAFWEDWKNYQFSFLGPNVITVIENGGDARIKGIESELQWAATNALTLSANVSLMDPRLTQNYCGELDPVTGQAAHSNPCPANPARPTPYAPLAPAGTNLPVTPKFKMNLVARYLLPDVGSWTPYVQAAFVYQTQTSPLLQTENVNVVGMQPAFGLLDLSGGIERNGMFARLLISNALDRRAELTRFVQCTVNSPSGMPVCGPPYVTPAQPRTIDIQFGQRF